MKTPALVWLFLSAAGTAAGAALPSFSDELLDQPTLSLSEAVKSGELQPTKEEPVPVFETSGAGPLGPVRIVSRMPIIEAGTMMNIAMPIGGPKAGLDLKLIIEDPGIEAAR